MWTLEEIRSMPDDKFYPRFKELGGKIRRKNATREEVEEFRPRFGSSRIHSLLLSANLEDRDRVKLKRDGSISREGGAAPGSAAWRPPQPNNFEELQRVRA